MLTVALSGGIASGKTAVSDLFHSLGVPVIDADLLSREAVAPDTPGLTAIRQRFGDNVIAADESLDRAALREIVFSDDKARSDLESIVHPEVRRLTQAALKQHASNNAAYCLIVIPLLVETGQQNSYDHVIIVDVRTETQLSRVMQRDGSSQEQAQKIISSQATRAQRLAVADSVIDNSGALETLRPQVEALHRKLLSIADTKPTGHAERD